MSSSYVIFSSEPDLCVRFYTHVLGLKNKKNKNKKKKKKKTDAKYSKIQHVTTTVKASVPFLLNHEYIMALPSLEDAPKNAIMEPVNEGVPKPCEIYFVVKRSLDEVCQRFKKASCEDGSRILHLEGVSNALRILHLLDPDGNKLRLVELA